MVNLKWWEDAEQLRLMNERFEAAGMNRRSFLRIVGAAGGATAVALAVAACGGSSSTSTEAPAATSAPTTA
ncbi:MAG TPA: peptide ABC transporter substrate-binding protein, partial [Thermomicrobiaceae bacterium]|nr:peptide ABC transporter substrate-binding protein [Thermomicrobiaceae bacterium]